MGPGKALEAKAWKRLSTACPHWGGGACTSSQAQGHTGKEPEGSQATPTEELLQGDPEKGYDTNSCLLQTGHPQVQFPGLTAPGHVGTEQKRPHLTCTPHSQQ